MSPFRRKMVLVGLLSALVLAGCAGAGGGKAASTGPDCEAPEPWPDFGDMDEVRRYLDPIGPDPAGVDTFTIEWLEPSGPTEAGRPLTWWDLQMEDFEFSLGDDWDWTSGLTSNLVINGSVVGTTSDPPAGFWRAGAHYSVGFEDGSWLSIGLSGGQGFVPVGGSQTVADFGMDLHVRGNLAVRGNGTRTHWLVGIRSGFYNWGGELQLNYGSGYGGLAADFPLGGRTYLTAQAILGMRWTHGGGYPFESFALETGIDLGIIIPLSGHDNSN